MAQRYASPIAHERMAEDRCPECGRLPELHEGSPNFWERRGPCDLMPRGVAERIEQYRADAATSR